MEQRAIRLMCLAAAAGDLEEVQVSRGHMSQGAGSGQHTRDAAALLAGLG